MPLRYDLEMWDLMDETPTRKLYPYHMVAVEGLRCFGWQERKKAGIGTPWHYHKDCFEIHYVYDGTVSFRVKGREYLLKAGDVFITFPNEYHGSGNNPFSGHKLYWFNLLTLERILGLNQEQSALLLEKLSQIRHRIIPATEDMKYMMERVLAHILTDDPYYRMVANCQMTSFLQRLIENDAAMAETTLSPEIQKAISFMEQNLHTGYTLDKIASHVGLSLSYFKAKFKREVGVAPADYYLDLRINKAKSLLSSGKTVTETADLLNFASTNYFSVVFRRVVAMTPTQYKKKAGKER